MVHFDNHPMTFEYGWTNQRRPFASITPRNLIGHLLSNQIKGVSVLSRCQYSSNSIISLLYIIEYRINKFHIRLWETPPSGKVSFDNGKSKRAVSWKGSNLSSRFYFIWYPRSPSTFSIGCRSLVSINSSGSAIKVILNSNNFISYDTPDHRSAAAHGVFDSKLGATKDQECQTCKQNFKDCPGHFGYIPVSSTR